MGIRTECGSSFRPAFDCGYAHPSPAVCRRTALRNIRVDLFGGQRRKIFLFPSRTSFVLARRPLGFLCRRALPVSDSTDIYSCCRIRLVHSARKDFSTNENEVAGSHAHLPSLCRRLARRDYYTSVESNHSPACCGTSFFKKRARFWFPGVGLPISSAKNGNCILDKPLFILYIVSIESNKGYDL